MKPLLMPLACVVGGLLAIFLLWSSFTGVSEHLRDAGLDPPLPLEEAAPEVVRHRDAFRRLATVSYERVPQCDKRSLDDALTLRGKVLVWDVNRNGVSEVYGRLAPEIRAQTPDGKITVFLILDQARSHTQTYTGVLDFHNQQPRDTSLEPVSGFRVDSLVAVVELPGGNPVGQFWVPGYETGNIVYVQERPDRDRRRLDQGRGGLDPGGRPGTQVAYRRPDSGRSKACVILTSEGADSRGKSIDMDAMLSRITIDSTVCHGKPCIRGLRYPVETLLDLLSSGMTSMRFSTTTRIWNATIWWPPSRSRHG